MPTRNDETTTLLLGAILGFVTGCCGLVVTALFFRRYVPGVLLGVGGRLVLAVCMGLSVDTGPGGAFESMPSLDQLESLGGGGTGPGVPWELIGAFVVGTATLTGLVAAGIWAFGPVDDDDDHHDDDPPPPQGHDQYITYTR